MTVPPDVAAALTKLHGAYDLLRLANDDLDQRWQGILGPVMDLVANVADLAEDAC